ncbi:Slowpoke-binding protein [Nymphon striatum]|nr:Slowpoke-binding protein [Nymphon striatum]
MEKETEEDREKLGVMMSRIGQELETWEINQLAKLRQITRSRYDYLTLQDENSHDEIERKAARKASVGTRPDRHWFLVNDSIIKTDRLMTITRISEKSPLLQLYDDEDAQKAVFELFLALQHPFIQPVLDINYKLVKEQMYVVIVFPFNKTGCLKDLIYNTKCQDTFAGKNNTSSSKPLEVAQIRTYGRQILEAILFLRDYREFPPIGEHLHSGNVIIQDGVARLTGYENIILGLRSKSHPTLRKKLKSHPESIDTISFGYIIFEMCTGGQLDTLHPSFKQLDTIHKRYAEVIQVLKYIFNMNEDFPKLEEVSFTFFY